MKSPYLPCRPSHTNSAATTATRSSHWTQRQQRLASRWQLLSPALVLHQLSTETADSSAATFADYRGRVRALHRQWQQMFIAPIAQGREMNLPAVERRPHWERGVIVAAGTGERQWRGVVLLIATALLTWAAAMTALQSGGFHSSRNGS